VWAPEL